MHQAVVILSDKMNKVMRQSYVLLMVRHDFNICMNRRNWNVIFKPGVPGFLELLLSANVCMFVCVCVSAPEAINN